MFLCPCLFLWWPKICPNIFWSPTHFPIFYGTQWIFCTHQRPNPLDGSTSSINKVFSLVVQEKSQRQIFIETMNPNPTALITKSVPTQHNRFPRQFPRKEKPVCTHCGITSHTADKCYKLHGFPPGFKFTNSHFLVQVLTMLLRIMERVFLKIHKSLNCLSLQSSVKSFWSFCKLTLIKLLPIK
jgi:hypothetical protein